MNSEALIGYECALTGLIGEPGIDDDRDGMGDVPVGWTRVQFVRRQYNPKWILIQQVKRHMIESLLQQVPPDLHEFQQYAISVQVEAQFHSLEEETPIYLPDVDETVYISDSAEIVDALNEVRSGLGLQPLPEEEEEDEDESPEQPQIESEESEESEDKDEE